MTQTQPMPTYPWLTQPPTTLAEWQAQLEAATIPDHFHSAKRWLGGIPALHALDYSFHEQAWKLLFATAASKKIYYDKYGKKFFSTNKNWIPKTPTK